MTDGFIESMLSGDRQKAEKTLQVKIAPGWPGEAERWLLRFRLEQMCDEPSTRQWLLRAIIRKTDDVFIGHIGFHGPPDDHDTLEIGYSVLPEHRRRGYALEAIHGLFDWAERARGIHRFRASVAPSNQPSLALVTKMRFFQTGVQWDEHDGMELVYELETRMSSRTGEK